MEFNGLLKYDNDPSYTCEFCNEDIEAYFEEYHDCTNCIFDDDGDNTPDGCNACEDHYVDDAGDCHPTCGVGRFGRADYNDRGYPDISWCRDCDNDCHECVQTDGNHCLSCNSGKYLQREANGAEYYQWGDCLGKDQWTWWNQTRFDDIGDGNQPGTYTATFYVAPPGSNANAVENIAGTNGDPYNYL